MYQEWLRDSTEKWGGGRLTAPDTSSESFDVNSFLCSSQCIGNSFVSRASDNPLGSIPRRIASMMSEARRSLPQHGEAHGGREVQLPINLKTLQGSGSP